MATPGDGDGLPGAYLPAAPRACALPLRVYHAGGARPMGVGVPLARRREVPGRLERFAKRFRQVPHPCQRGC